MAGFSPISGTWRAKTESERQRHRRSPIACASVGLRDCDDAVAFRDVVAPFQRYFVEFLKKDLTLLLIAFLRFFASDASAAVRRLCVASASERRRR